MLNLVVQWKKHEKKITITKSNYVNYRSTRTNQVEEIKMRKRSILKEKVIRYTRMKM